MTTHKGSDRLYWYLDPPSPIQLKQNIVKVGPPLTKLSGSPHGDPQRLRPACAYAQSDQSLCYSLEYSMTVKLPTEQR